MTEHGIHPVEKDDFKIACVHFANVKLTMPYNISPEPNFHSGKHAIGSWMISERVAATTSPKFVSCLSEILVQLTLYHVES